MEGDYYDEEKEVLQKDRPEMLSPADTDAPLVLHAGPMGSVDVNAEEVDGQKVVPAYTVIFNKTLNRHSPSSSAATVGQECSMSASTTATATPGLYLYLHRRWSTDREYQCP